MSSHSFRQRICERKICDSGEGVAGQSERPNIEMLNEVHLLSLSASILMTAERMEASAMNKLCPLWNTRTAKSGALPIG